MPLGRMRGALKSFIVNRVLSDSGVLAKYTKGRCKVPSGKFEKEYREEMRALVLYRLMVLIVFLDRAKGSNVLDQVPRLFTKCSSVKSSRAVFQTLCRDFLSSEGDFIKHLSRIGVRVYYEQNPVDELDYRVSNLAVDLRDGVCLTRVTEILTKSPPHSLMTKLRLPVVSRLQKLYNVSVAMSALKEFGVAVPDDINAHHIVDGHREIVLKTMWSIIAHFCIRQLLDQDRVQEEIAIVMRSNHARRKIGRQLPATFVRLSDHTNLEHSSPEQILKSLLFRWCYAVCSCFGLELRDFTSSFADGKALCLLIHYYHPSILRLEEILPTSSDELDGLNCEMALSNERANSFLARSRVADLGGIPKMLPITDVENPPDEKSMLVCLAFMCSRLMESSREIFATILIQSYYRRYRSAILQEKKEAAALLIYRKWCQRKESFYVAQRRKYQAAVNVLEDFVVDNKKSLMRLKNARLKEAAEQSAAIQIQVRMVQSNV